MARYLFIILWFVCVALFLTVQVEAQLEPGDDVDFIKDLTYPDGTKVNPGEKMVKKWEVKNSGSVAWTGRQLKATESTAGEKDLASIEKTKVPDTKPGEKCTLEATMKAPTKNGKYKVTFKMVNEEGKEYFPNKKAGVYIEVVVE